MIQLHPYEFRLNLGKKNLDESGDTLKFWCIMIFPSLLGFRSQFTQSFFQEVLPNTIDKVKLPHNMSCSTLFHLLKCLVIVFIRAPLKVLKAHLLCSSWHCLTQICIGPDRIPQCTLLVPCPCLLWAFYSYFQASGWI